MPEACSGTQASDRFGITLDFVTKLHNGSISEDEAKRFLRREDPFAPRTVAVPVKPAPLLSPIAMTQLNAMRAKKTAKCFTGPRYAYRKGDLDRWLPASQPKTAACVISTLTPAKDMTFAQWAATVLGGPADMPLNMLGSLLIGRGHTMTPAQAEAMVGKTEHGEATGMRTDGWGNFFFVETGDENDPVSVAYVRRYDSRWYAIVHRLGRGNRWSADGRLLVRNLDASKLGL